MSVRGLNRSEVVYKGVGSVKVINRSIMVYKRVGGLYKGFKKRLEVLKEGVVGIGV